MAALSLKSPLPKKSLANLRESSKCGCKISKSSKLVCQTSLRRWQSVAAHQKSVRWAHCSASSAQVTCSAGLAARCYTEQQSQTATIQHQSAVLTDAQVQGKEKTPELDDELDDGGTRGGPRGFFFFGGGGPWGNGGDGPWGNGGGGPVSFFFFGILVLLSFVKESKDKDDEGIDHERQH